MKLLVLVFFACFFLDTNAFAAVQYNITVTQGANGAITPSGVVTVNANTSPKFTIKANANYKINDVIVDGVSKGAVASHTFSKISANHTITSTFALITYTIRATPGANGSITPAGTTVVDRGASKTYFITPNPGYHIVNVVVNGTSKGAVSSYTFNNVTTNYNIGATFAASAYTLSTSSYPSAQYGTVGKNPNLSTYTFGAQVALTATANPGYRFVMWAGDAIGSTSNPLTITVDANKNYIAMFDVEVAAPVAHFINASAGENGTISPIGATAVASGASQSYSITPNSGYGISDVLVDGQSVGPVSFYAFNNVVATHAISASFAVSTAPPPMPTPAALYALKIYSSDGTLSALVFQRNYSPGAQLTITQGSSVNYTFVNWSGDIGVAVLPATNPLIIIMDSDKTITANFTHN